RRGGPNGAPPPRPPAPETDAGRAGARGEDRTRKTESIVRSAARRLTAGGTDFRATEPPRSGRTRAPSIHGPSVWTGRALQAESDDLEKLVSRFCIRPIE